MHSAFTDSIVKMPKGVEIQTPMCNENNSIRPLELVMDTSQSYAGIAFWETGWKKLQLATME